MTSRYFQRQIAHYTDSKLTRFIVFARAHGRSTKALGGVNYIQHAKDLKQFIEELSLKDVVIGGWSWGGITVYTYLSLFGTDNIKGVVTVDQTPRPLPAGEGSWSDGGADAVKGFFDAMVNDRKATVTDFIPWMLAETMMTPNIVATQLLYDDWMFDHNQTVKKTNIPQLYFVREENESPAKAFLSKSSPNADIVIMVDL